MLSLLNAIWVQTRIFTNSFSTFIVAATDTTTSAISRILGLLVEHPEVQSRLREEVTTARKQHGDLDYDTLQALPFLDAVCRETLRVYCPVPSILRQQVHPPPCYSLNSFHNTFTAPLETLCFHQPGLLKQSMGKPRSRKSPYRREPWQLTLFWESIQARRYGEKMHENGNPNGG